MRYRSKPTETEARQWLCSNPTPNNLQDTAADIVFWVNANGGEASLRTDDAPDGSKTHRIAVRTINGWAYARPGHYVVMGTATFKVEDRQGPERRLDFYPCDPDTFEKSWEPV